MTNEKRLECNKHFGTLYAISIALFLFSIPPRDEILCTLQEIYHFCVWIHLKIVTFWNLLYVFSILNATGIEFIFLLFLHTVYTNDIGLIYMLSPYTVQHRTHSDNNLTAIWCVRDFAMSQRHSQCDDDAIFWNAWNQKILHHVRSAQHSQFVYA